MNEVESQEATAQELVAFAKQQGLDLSSTCHEFAFFGDGRFLLLWRKAGMLHYNLQGKIGEVPTRLKESASSFRGVWHETGSLADLKQALDFLKAWLLERREVDDLPERSIRSFGI